MVVESRMRTQSFPLQCSLKFGIAGMTDTQVQESHRRADSVDSSTAALLVVDDNQDAAQTLTRLLKVLGFRASAAFSGEAALEVIKEEAPALVFLDLGMPTMDGVETARRIRQIPEGQKISLVALTGLGREEDLARTRAVGFDAHLVKPVNLTQLQETLGRFLGAEATSKFPPQS
jgi:CheY-like chemotaxis protein